MFSHPVKQFQNYKNASYLAAEPAVRTASKVSSSVQVNQLRNTETENGAASYKNVDSECENKCDLRQDKPKDKKLSEKLFLSSSSS
jgi:hypothetical protein